MHQRDKIKSYLDSSTSYSTSGQRNVFRADSASNSDKFKDYYNSHQRYQETRENYSGLNTASENDQIKGSTYQNTGDNNNNYSQRQRAQSSLYDHFDSIQNRFQKSADSGFQIRKNSTFQHRALQGSNVESMGMTSDNFFQGRNRRVFTTMGSDNYGPGYENEAFPCGGSDRFGADSSTQKPQAEQGHNMQSNIERENISDQTVVKDRSGQEREVSVSKRPTDSKKQYYEKANKKISLKKDISPRYGGRFAEDSSSAHSNIETVFQREKMTSFFDSESVSKRGQGSSTTLSEMQKMEDPFSGSQYSELSSKAEYFREGDHRFMKKNSIDYSANDYPQGNHQNYDFTEATSSEVLSASEKSSASGGMGANGCSSPTSAMTGQIIKNNPSKAAKSKAHGRTEPPQIDSQIYADMKISRIEETTNSMTEKLNRILKELASHSGQLKDHKSALQSLGSRASKGEEEALSAQDMKRLKKEVRIMKTNFETAFSSMTEQINRKLVKEETIMKSLSEEIGLLAEDGRSVREAVASEERTVQSLREAVASEQRTVQSLSEMMSGYMRENEERLENIINDSFSSKRSKGSLEYGLDLKNMSGEEGRGHTHDGLSKRLEELQREVKKMKLFHMDEQDAHRKQLAELGSAVAGIEETQKRHLQRASCLQGSFKEEVERRVKRLEEEAISNKQSVCKLSQELRDGLYEQKSSPLLPSSHQSIPEQRQTERVNEEFRNQLQQMGKKQRSLMSELVSWQGKLAQVDDRVHGLSRCEEEAKAREEQARGELRGVQSRLSESGSQLKQFVEKFKELDRINEIQTENIESINCEFERVINKEVIPKFGEVHHLHGELGFKVGSLTSDLNALRLTLKTLQSLGAATSGHKGSFGSASEDLLNLENKLSTMLDKGIDQKIQSFAKKVKVIQARALSQGRKGQLSKLGVLQAQNSHRPQTYLVDQNGYLMDGEGCYLLETLNGSSQKIKVSEEDLYFMQVNGVSVTEIPLEIQ